MARHRRRTGWARARHRPAPRTAARRGAGWGLRAGPGDVSRRLAELRPRHADRKVGPLGQPVRAGLGALHTGLAYVLLYAGMARLPAGRIAVLQFIYPAVAVLLDWVVYGRVLGAVQAVGIGLMALALWTLRRPSRTVE